MSWTPERWRRLEPHLDKLLDLPEGDRAAYLDGLPAEDLELRVDIERLLAAPEGEDLQSLSTLAPNLLGAVADEEIGPDPLLNRTLGAYRLLERIGSGGMGLVYRAERMDEAYRQEVAVKVLRWTAGPDLVRRFQRERETLALLDHPNVTRILDGGVSDDGISYLVMELVYGSPITEAGGDLNIKQRVRLFLDICAAVHSAHQRLIVHRDLKPSNVVVAEDGTVKVLDFGIAKWLEEDDTIGGAILTRTGDRYLTPQYASPEQFRGEAVTTASDVYALGLLLYELLTGKTPYELEGKTPTEQDRLICQDAPPSPASVISESGNRMVRGDLERVVLKTLRKEPERRYHSAEALADDLRAWLDGHPVSATPDSRGYRFRRFVSRNRAGATAGAAIAIALIVGLGGMAWQAGVASRERDRAQIEAQHSQEVVTFLLDAIAKASPWESPEEVTVAQLLDASAERLDHELRDQPDLRLALLLTIGEAYAHTNRLEESIELFDRAESLADSLYGIGSTLAAEALYNKARSVITLGSPDSSRTLYKRAEAMLRPREDAESRKLLASVLEEIGFTIDSDPESVLALCREALAIREALYDGPHSDLARSYHYMSATLSSLNDPSAPYWFSRAADMWRMTVGDPDANLAGTLNNWALWYHNHGKVDSASTLYREALEMQVKIHGESPAISNTLVNIGNFYIQAERYEDAREMLERALAIIVPARGDVVGTGAAWANLGHVELFLENHESSEAAYNEARRIFVKVFGAEHVFPAVIDVYLGRLYWKWERDAEARSRFTSGLGKFQAVHPAVARREGPGRVWQGRFLMERGDLEQAERVLRRGLELCEDQFSEDQWDRAEAAAALGICLIKSGDRDEGLPLLREGHDALSRIRGPEHPMTIWAAEARAKAEAGA